MKKIIMIIVCMASLAAAQETEMRVTRVLKDKFTANAGLRQGVKTNDCYFIVKNNKVIGKAQVIVSRTNICIMELTDLVLGYEVTPGNKLILEVAEKQTPLIPVGLQELSSEQIEFSEKQKIGNSSFFAGAFFGGFFIIIAYLLITSD